MPVFTIGHSTRTLEELVAQLEAHGVVRLADIRTVPRSRRHPQFGIDVLARALPEAGIAYRHFPRLGGLRRPRPDSTNAAWRHPGFCGYADYMQTPAFDRALGELLAFAGEPAGSAASRSRNAGGDAEGTRGMGPAAAGRPGHAVVMCAEALWWRCHRRLVADALAARGVEVRHIVSRTVAEPHRFTEFGRVRDGRVSYPGIFDAP